MKIQIAFIIPLLILLGTTWTVVAQDQTSADNSSAVNTMTTGTCYNMGYLDGFNNSTSTCVTTGEMNSSQISSYCAGFNFAHSNSNTQTEQVQQTNQNQQGVTGNNDPCTDFGDLNDLSNIPLVGSLIASHK